MSEIRKKLFRGKWYAVWRENGETKRQSLRTDDHSEADKRLADFIKSASVQSDEIEDIMQAYFEDRSGMASIVSAKARYEKHLKPIFGGLLPEHIDRKRCRDYTALRRKAKVSDWSIRRELGILRAGILWHNKHAEAVFELPPEGKSRDRYLTRKEYAKLLEGARAPHIKLFIVLALSTAGRMGALLDLTWDRVDFKHGFITLANGQHKVKGRATVPMTPEVKTALEDAYKGRTCNYVIEHGGQKVASVKKGISEAARRAGLEGVSAHVLRHTSAVWMATGGVQLEKIAQFMGHTEARVTFKHYARYAPSHLSDAVKALSGKKVRKGANEP